jgi:3-hydroxy-9,10-secoandrosta-1,3,5(10)-triene-9,17-dione monooxygenase
MRAEYRLVLLALSRYGSDRHDNELAMNLVDRARELAPAFTATAGNDANLRRLSDETWRHLLDGGFLRALQPARWGGGEAHLAEFVDAVVEISRASPSAGWVAGVIGVHPWQLALFDDAAQREMWGRDAATMHSSSYNPTGKAEKVDGGYRVWGRWSFSSGCDHCKGVNLGASVGMREAGGVSMPDFRSFLLLEGQYRIEDNWHVAGLRGTGSKDIVVEDALVPAYRSQSHLDYATNLPLPGRAQNDGVLYRLPWSVVFNMALAASVLGCARGFVDAWILETQPRRLAAGLRATDDPLTQKRLAEATWLIDATLTQMRADVNTLWAKAEARSDVPMQQRAQMRWNMNRGCDLVGNAVVELMRAASGRSIFLDHPLQRRFQDVQGALGHAFLVPDPLARAVGAHLLGAAKQEFVL